MLLFISISIAVCLLSLVVNFIMALKENPNALIILSCIVSKCPNFFMVSDDSESCSSSQKTCYFTKNYQLMKSVVFYLKKTLGIPLIIYLYLFTNSINFNFYISIFWVVSAIKMESLV